MPKELAKYDTNKDQKISSEEAEELVQDIFSKLDTNNDGEITEEEFVNGILANEELSKILTFEI